MIQHLCKTTAKLWHSVLAGTILTVRALWLLQMMRMDRGSIHSHPCVPSSSEDRLVAQSSPSMTASTTQPDSAETPPTSRSKLAVSVLMMFQHHAQKHFRFTELQRYMVNNFLPWGACKSA